MNATLLIGTTAEVVAFASAVFLVGVTVKNYANLPETIATHFGLRGEPNGWGPRGVVLIMPIVGVVLFLTLTALNPIVGLDRFVLGPGAAQSPTITVAVLAGAVMLTAAVSQAMIAFILGQTRRMASPTFILVVVFAALAIALASYFESMSVR